MDYLSKGPVVAAVLEGHGAVALVRKIVGATAPGDALPGSIRGDYALDTYKLAEQIQRAVYNVIHASGSLEEASREIALWFNASELLHE